jgi:hypothetical protein
MMREQVIQDPKTKFLQLLERVHLLMDDHQDALARLKQIETELKSLIEITEKPQGGKP